MNFAHNHANAPLVYQVDISGKLAELLAPRLKDMVDARCHNCGSRLLARSDGYILVNRVWVWKRECPPFNRRVRELRADMTNKAVGRIVDAMAGAVETLDELRSSESEGIRLRASDALLNHGTALTAIAEIQERLARLEDGGR